MNDSIKQGTKEYNATNRSALAQGAIMREVYSTSTAIAISLGNSTKRITEAVARAKDLGLSLAEVDGIANSLLNVEQSIASEFEYEVISGKQINLEAARYYALTNQTEKLTAEIGKNQAIVNSFASGNRIEQEAAAKALGLSRDQLAEMYIAQQRKNKLTDAEIAKNILDNEIIAQILDILDTYIKPAVENDGGLISFKSFNEETGLVTVELKGSCSGCPSSTVTLKKGIEGLLTRMVPQVKEVVAESL
jgi:Fe-S cluster biogenesis protein NfuA